MGLTNISHANGALSITQPAASTGKNSNPK